MKKVLIVIISLLIISGCGSYGGMPSEQVLKEEYCSNDIYDCENFVIQEDAQELFELCGGVDNDIHKLDKESNGIACENLIE